MLVFWIPFFCYWLVALANPVQPQSVDSDSTMSLLPTISSSILPFLLYSTILSVLIFFGVRVFRSRRRRQRNRRGIQLGSESEDAVELLPTTNADVSPRFRDEPLPLPIPERPRSAAPSISIHSPHTIPAHLQSHTRSQSHQSLTNIKFAGTSPLERPKSPINLSRGLGLSSPESRHKYKKRGRSASFESISGPEFAGGVWRSRDYIPLPTPLRRPFSSEPEPDTGSSGVYSDDPFLTITRTTSTRTLFGTLVDVSSASTSTKRTYSIDDNPFSKANTGPILEPTRVQKEEDALLIDFGSSTAPFTTSSRDRDIELEDALADAASSPLTTDFSASTSVPDSGSGLPRVSVTDTDAEDKEGRVGGVEYDIESGWGWGFDSVSTSVASSPGWGSGFGSTSVGLGKDAEEGERDGEEEEENKEQRLRVEEVGHTLAPEPIKVEGVIADDEDAKQAQGLLSFNRQEGGEAENDNTYDDPYDSYDRHDSIFDSTFDKDEDKDTITMDTAVSFDKDDDGRDEEDEDLELGFGRSTPYPSGNEASEEEFSLGPGSRVRLRIEPEVIPPPSLLEEDLPTTTSSTSDEHEDVFRNPEIWVSEDGDKDEEELEETGSVELLVPHNPLSPPPSHEEGDVLPSDFDKFDGAEVNEPGELEEAVQPARDHVENKEKEVEEFPDPDDLPLPELDLKLSSLPSSSAPLVPESISPSPSYENSKPPSPTMQIPTPPASPPGSPMVQRRTLALALATRTNSGTGAGPVSAGLGPMTPPAWSLRAADAPALGISSNIGSPVVSKKDLSMDKKEKENSDPNSTAKDNEKPKEVIKEAEPTLTITAPVPKAVSPIPTFGIARSTSLPGSFPVDVHPLSDSPSPAPSSSSSSLTKSIPNPKNSSGKIKITRSPIDIALAMQLRPGLGLGADPAWMVRFLMAMFGWVVVLVSGSSPAVLGVPVAGPVVGRRR